MNLPLNSLIDRNDSTAVARYHMIQQQIRPWDVHGDAVLHALETVRREDFVPPSHYAQAFMDVDIPLRAGDNAPVMLSPKVEARMINDLDILPTDRVLEIGTGSGYSAALLSHVCQSVVTLEIDAELAEQARENLQSAGCTNVTVRQANAVVDALAEGPFDVILLSGSVEVLPEDLLAHLKEGGRLGAIVGCAPVMRFTIVTKQNGATVITTPWDTVAPRLSGFATQNRFSF